MRWVIALNAKSYVHYTSANLLNEKKQKSHHHTQNRTKKGILSRNLAFQVALVVKNPPANAGDTALIPGSGRFPGGGHCNPLQYSCLENPMDRGVWQATAHGVAKSWTWLKWLRTHTCKTWIVSSLVFFAFFILLWTKQSLLKHQLTKNVVTTSHYRCPDYAPWGEQDG